MEWAATHADVVSMCLGSNEPSDGTTPMDQSVDTLSDATGALFVIASGNNGMVGGISAPGAADAALTVGAVDGQDQLAYFSNMGPRFGDSALKPDIVAPGVDISAARSHFVDGTGDYQTMSGTSMATPHVAGAAAILAQLHPGWSGTAAQGHPDELGEGPRPPRRSSPFAELISASLSCWPVQERVQPARIAAAPATCGVAIEVPLIVW